MKVSHPLPSRRPADGSLSLFLSVDTEAKALKALRRPIARRRRAAVSFRFAGITASSRPSTS